jgi:hypothetical protein
VGATRKKKNAVEFETLNNKYNNNNNYNISAPSELEEKEKRGKELPVIRSTVKQ